MPPPTTPAHPPAPEVTTRNTAIGIAFLLGEIAVFMVVGSLVKILSPDIPVIAILFCRYVFSLPVLFAYGAARRGRSVLAIRDAKNLIRRIIFGFIGLVFMYAAFAYIEISLAVALFQLMPIFITLMGIVMLGEEGIGPRRIAAVCAGFCGVIVLLGPGEILASLTGESGAPFTGGRGLGIGFAILGAFFSALMLIYLRRVGRSDPAISTTLWYNITGAVFAFICGLPGGSMAVLFSGGIPQETWLLLVAVGVLSSFQQFMLALSYVFAPASTLAPVHYANIPMAAAVGIAVFGETITWEFVTGSAIIIGANYYIFVRGSRKMEKS